MILVTGAGGAAGVAVIRALCGRGEGVVAVDADPLAAGLALADEHAVVAKATDETFLPDLRSAIARFGVDTVICTVAEEMLVLADHELGAAIWLPAKAAIATCVDKRAFAAALHAARIPSPATGDEVPGPWIVKPRFGRGSRDVYAVDSADELQWAVRRVEQPIVQTRVEGSEFTVDVLTDHDGRVVATAPRWRLETKAGISTKGRTFRDATVEHLAARTVEVLDLRAAVNVQGFVTNDGSVQIIEVNPRVSGGLSLSQAAGADIVGELVRGTRGKEPRREHLRFAPDVTMSRHFVEVFS
jgi:carbamoyl-phosphate synthase large subunit